MDCRLNDTKEQGGNAGADLKLVAVGLVVAAAIAAVVIQLQH